MTGTSTLDPFSTKSREAVKVNPRDQLGGSMEYIEELLGGTMDLILKGPQGPLVNETTASFEAGEPIQTPVPEFVRQSFSSGTIENFQAPRLNSEIQIGQAIHDVMQAHREASIRPSVDQKRAEMNQLLGFDPSYRATMDNQGNSREYYESQAENKLNTKTREKELKTQREAMKTQALRGKGKSFMGENELLKGGENSNHWTKGVG